MSSEPSPFRYAAFRHALIARAVSSAGSWMQTVAAGWLVYDLTRNATAVGVLTVLSRGPGFLLSTYGGELADRYDRRRLGIVLYIVAAIPAALLAALVWDGDGGLVFVYVATTIIGVAGALSGSTMQQVVTSTVPPELAKRATGLSSLAYNLARLVGPALGGGLVTAIGPGPCFAINAASYLAVIALLVSMPPMRAGAAQSKVKVAAAIAEVKVSPLLRALFTGALLFSVIVAPVQELAPAIGAMVICGVAWDVVYVISLVGVQFDDHASSGLMTGLYISATLGGVTLGALAVGALFDVVGVSNGLGLLAVAIALSGLHIVRAGERRAALEPARPAPATPAQPQ